MPTTPHALKYPIGEYVSAPRFDAAKVDAAIATIAALPGRLTSLVAALSSSDLARVYRPGGWNVRQVVHHLGDSHVNCYVRYKLALTEDNPTIKPYFEDRWADLPETATGDLALSLRLIEALHAKWVSVLKSLDEAAWHRSWFNPESGKRPTLFDAASLYAWHGEHHLAHIRIALGMAPV